MEAVSYFHTAFQRFDQLAQSSSQALEAIRNSAQPLLMSKGLQTLEDESWKYTSLRALASFPFQWTESSRDLRKFAESVQIPHTLPVISIHGQLQSFPSEGSALRIRPLHEACAQDPKLFEKFKQSLEREDGPSSRINKAFLHFGVCIEVADQHQVEKPIHLIHVLESSEEASLCSFHNLIDMGENSSLSLIESVITLSPEVATPFLKQASTSFFLEKHAKLHYAKFQRQGAESFSLGQTRLFQKEQSQSFAFFDTADGRLARESIFVELSEPYAEVHMQGLFHTQTHEHSDYYVSLHHQASYTKSRQCFKGVAESQSRGVFNAHIKVDEKLCKVDAHQLSKNLVLGPDAEIDAKPHLEIDSDDVKCAHGAAIGRLRGEELFYCESRGIPRAKAERMLSEAFLDELVLNIEDPLWQNQISAHRTQLNKLIYEKIGV